MLTLARSVSARGELTLLRRADGALELRVNGLFAMDTAESSSERMLASASIAAAAAPSRQGGPDCSLRVLVGGLGLGFTVAALLADRRVAEIVVAEIEPDLVRWHRSGVVPSPMDGGAGTGLLSDPRLDVVIGDVREVVAAQAPETYDLVLLDVDNGPGFLLHSDNAAVYREPFLATCARAVRAGGVAAIWSASESATLSAAMSAVFASTDTQSVPVTLDRRRTHYYLYIGRTARSEGVRRAG